MEQAGTASGSAALPLPQAAVRNGKWVRRLLAAGVAVAFIGVAAVFSWQAGQQVGVRKLQTAAVHRLDVFRASFFSPIERYDYLPDLLAVHPTVVANLAAARSPGRTDELNRFLEASASTAKLSAVYVIDPTGLTVASSNWKSALSFVGKNFSFRPYFQEAIKGGTGRFYGIGTTTGIPGYFMTRPIKQNGRILGVLAIKIDLENLDQQWDAEADEITVSDDSGVIFLSSRLDWKYRMTRPLTPDVIAKLRETRQYTTMLKPPLEVIQDPIWPYANVVRLQDVSPPHATRRYLVLNYQMPQANWLITTYSLMDEVDAVAMRYALSGAGAAAFLVLLTLYGLQFRKRVKEKQAARAAADIAHEKLEAKHKELENLSEHLRTMAISDPLTGCHNRRYFIEISAKMVSAAQRHHRIISILMLDIDFFKKVNDTYGHQAGDEVLKAVATVCKATVRAPDFLVRFGGEEFVAVLPDTTQDEAVVVAERVRAAVELLQVQTGTTVINVTVSIGLSSYVETENTIDKAVARADLALYQAKRRGRNQVVVYTPDMEDVTEPAGA
jgi:two-component system C4-dicarboxylate transport sensor histidine kinase DctB